MNTEEAHYAWWVELREKRGLVKLSAELEQTTGLKVSPWAVFVREREIQKLVRSVTAALPGFQALLKQYWRELPEGGPTVSLLERGLSAHWREASRIPRKASITSLSFDFQRGMLIELNSNPPLPWAASELQKAVADTTNAASGVLKYNQVKAFLWPYLERFPYGRLGIVKNDWWAHLLSEALGGYEVRNFGNPLEALRTCQVLWVPSQLKKDEATSLVKAFVKGEVSLFPHPQVRLLTSKNLLAIISNPEERAQLKAARLTGALRQHLLWARVLTEDVLSTVEFLQRSCGQVVVKAFETSGGRQTETRQVLQAARTILGKGIVQEYAPPYEIPGTKLKYDLRIQCIGGKIFVSARIFTGEKMNLSHPESGMAPVFVI